MNSDAYHAFMLDHSTGSLPVDMALAAELHILLSERGHETLRLWHTARDVLGAWAAETRMADHECLPEALELARGDFETVPWKKGLSGVHYAKRGKVFIKLMRLDPGQAVPEHSHSPLEAAMVLVGEFVDGIGI